MALPRRLRSLMRDVFGSRSPSAGIRSRTRLSGRLIDVFLRTWDLGFTAFGGPPVHFQILHRRFVEGRGGKEKWVDEQTYQELFAVCQGLPGPASTKMLFCLALQHAGPIAAIMTFFIWSLPGAVGMYSLSLGVQRMSEVLPSPVYALLSGLNSATVGIIALAAVQLAEKAIRDKLTRILVIFGGTAGICYSTLWYFPTLMAVGGLTAVVWDGWLSQAIRKLLLRYRNRGSRPPVEAEPTPTRGVAIDAEAAEPAAAVHRRAVTPLPSHRDERLASSVPEEAAQGPSPVTYSIRMRVGIALTIAFLVLVVHSVVSEPPLVFSLFTNMYLAGTIIFGGGPVAIPLLRSYVVDPGWVTSRDFLLGLAIIQAFPGPNFNFAVYLGALATQNSGYPTICGSLLGFFGIFVPGITLAAAVQSIWHVLRRKKWVTDLLRGVNATAIGLVFTAVYRLWEIGYVTPTVNSGQSLALNPWWVVVATVSYAGSAWFHVPPALAIMSGGLLGLVWYAVVGH